MSVELHGNPPEAWDDDEICPPETLLAELAVQDQSTWPERLKLHLQSCEVCPGIIHLVKDQPSVEESLNQFFARIKAEAEPERKPRLAWAQSLWAYVTMPEMRFGVATSALVVVLFAVIWQVGRREEAVNRGNVKESTPVTLSFAPDEWQPLRDLSARAASGHQLSKEELATFESYKQRAKETPPLNSQKNAEVNTMIVATQAKIDPMKGKNAVLSGSPLQSQPNSLPPDSQVLATLWEISGASQQVLADFKKATPAAEVGELNYAFHNRLNRIISTNDSLVRCRAIESGMNVMNVVEQNPGSIVLELHSPGYSKAECKALDIGLETFKKRSNVQLFLKTANGQERFTSFSQAFVAAPKTAQQANSGKP